MCTDWSGSGRRAAAGRQGHDGGVLAEGVVFEGELADGFLVQGQGVA